MSARAQYRSPAPAEPRRTHAGPAERSQRNGPNTGSTAKPYAEGCTYQTPPADWGLEPQESPHK
eukprot:14416690-Alexandrium_andersonii.AAC.1